jgi:hypothetical protein
MIDRCVVCHALIDNDNGHATYCGKKCRAAFHKRYKPRPPERREVPRTISLSQAYLEYIKTKAAHGEDPPTIPAASERAKPGSVEYLLNLLRADDACYRRE